VRDAERAVAGRAFERILQRLNLANRTQAGQVMGIIDDGDACGVVAPIFEPPQSFHQYGNDITLSDCTDNSTHAFQALVAAHGRSPGSAILIQFSAVRARRSFAVRPLAAKTPIRHRHVNPGRDGMLKYADWPAALKPRRKSHW